MSTAWSYLLECSPYDPATSGVKSVRFANNIADDAALGQSVPYFIRLKQAFSHETSVFDQNLPGGTVVSSGSAVIANSDGLLDYLLDYSWDGRDVRVLRGVPGGSYASYVVEFVGSSVEMTADGDNLVLALRDNSWKLAKPLQNNTYLGTGGKEGGADLKGRRKPLLLGPARNFVPIPVDQARQIYQLHDGTLANVSKVYDRAVPLSFSQNYASYAALQAAGVAGGFYATCLAEGFIKLGAKLAGDLTVDATGAFSTATNVPDLVKGVIKTYGGLTDSDLDLTLFAQAASDASQDYEGFYFNEPDIQIDSLIESMVAGINGFWFLTRAGKFAVRQFKFRTPSTSVRAEDVVGLQRQSSPAELYRVKLNYARNCTVQEAGSFTLPSQTLNGYLKDYVVYVATAADGSGGTYTYQGEFSVFLNDTQVNDLGSVYFSNVTGSSWCTIDSAGKISFTDPGQDTASVVLRASMGEFVLTETFTVVKSKGSNPKNLTVATDRRFFYYDASNNPLPTVQTATLTLTGANLTTPYTWTATDNLGNITPLSGSGTSVTLPIANLLNSMFVSWVNVSVNSANGAYNTCKILAVHGDDGYAAGILSALAASSGGVTIFYQSATPTGAVEGDYWYDTDDGNKVYRYTGGLWVAVSDTRIADAITAAATAQATADGKVKTFFTESSPTPSGVGDLWYQPSTKILKRWDGSAWLGVSTFGADVNGQLIDSGAGGAPVALTREQIITALGTAANITGQGALATLSQVTSAYIADAAVTIAKFASGLEPVSIVSSVPGTKSTNTIFNSTNGKIYRWNGSAYVATVPTTDLSGTIAAAQIADSAVTLPKFGLGLEPVSVVTTLPTVKTTNTVFYNEKLYRWNGTAYTKDTLAVDIDARGLSVLDSNGVPVFGADGTIGSTANLNVNGSNVLLSTVAANSLVPSIHYVGDYSTPPTSGTLGANWKQNAVYKNTTDGKSYVLTGTPLAWEVYLESGTNFSLTIESTNGTIFRNGGGSSTTLKAHLFKNGAEVTDVTPSGWFQWRRVSAIPQAAPNDDATWNALYSSGYKQVTITVDSVYARASFFCDIISP